MKLNYLLTKGIVILLFTFLGIAQSQAQVTFKPGLRGGANFVHFTKGDYYYDDYYGPDRVDFSSKTDFYIGFYGAVKLSKYYTLQPGIDYSAQGSSFRTSNDKGSLNIDYLSFNVINKFTFGTLFNIHLGPTLDFAVNKDFRSETNFDMGFVLGAGINFTPNFGIEARVKKGVIPVFYNDFSDTYHTNVVFSLGGTYTFDTLK
ncbi:MAG TPA: outer membrane beta-barrel protein [Flavobacterium sp.]